MHWIFEPDPINAPGRHAVILRSDDGAVIGTGQGEDDTAALSDLWQKLKARGADHSLVQDTARLYGRTHRDQRGSEPPWTRETLRCPRCRARADEHREGECLDRWVHEAFLGKRLAEAETPPPYSQNLVTPLFDDVVDHEGWPRNWALTKTGDGWAVGEKTTQYTLTPAAEGEWVMLAVCRAAMCAPDWGDVKLEVLVPVPRRR
jgi:hypothetical protein